MSRFARQSIRWKLTAYTLVPVVLVFAILLTIGVSDTRSQLAGEAQRRLVTDAKHQAARLALDLGQIPLLAEGLGDLMLSDPEQPQSLLYAHLIDGLRRTPLALQATVSFDDPLRSASLRRGEESGSAPLAPPRPRSPQRGWQRHGDRLVFLRPLIVRGKAQGGVRVETAVADVYATLERGRAPDTQVVIRDAGGLLPPPRSGSPLLAAIAGQNRAAALATVASIDDTDGAAHWMVEAELPGLPLSIIATTPTASALAPARRQMLRVAAVLLAALAGIVVLVGLTARRLTAPLQSLDAAVEQIRLGRFDIASDVRSGDELGRLATAVQRMAHEIEGREAELRSAQQALEHRVAERTRALRQTNAQLKAQYEELRRTEQARRLASQRAEQASKAKSEFLSHVSHELRTPLHGILGYAQILRRDAAADATMRQSLLAIERCGQHLLTLINQILDLTRIEAGQLTVKRTAVDLVRLLEDVELIIAERAQAKGLRFAVERGDGLPPGIRTDPVRLRQILLNLVGNAVKFTSSGQVTLTVRPCSEDRLEFIVEDTGVGIPEEQLERIFDPFHRFGGRPAVEGTGLGLSINNKLIEQLGGTRLEVESTPGTGSRFRFRLPAPQARAFPGADRARAAAPPAGEAAASCPAEAWPHELAAATAERIRAAADMGDVAGLLQLVDRLAADPSTPGGAADRLRGMAQSFDFDGLRSVAAELEDGAAGNPGQA